MFNEVKVAVSCFPAKKRLEERHPLPEGSGELLEHFKKLLTEHESKDDRFMSWLVDGAVEAALSRYVACEAEIAHYTALGYDKEVAEHKAQLVRLEAEWAILTALYRYFQAARMEADAVGIAEYFRRQYPAKPAKKGAKS